MDHFIELTDIYTERRVLVRVESIKFVFEDADGCRVDTGAEDWIKVKESYKDIRRMIASIKE